MGTTDLALVWLVLATFCLTTTDGAIFDSPAAIFGNIIGSKVWEEESKAVANDPRRLPPVGQAPYRQVPPPPGSNNPQTYPPPRPPPPPKDSTRHTNSIQQAPVNRTRQGVNREDRQQQRGWPPPPPFYGSGPPLPPGAQFNMMGPPQQQQQQQQPPPPWQQQQQQQPQFFQQRDLDQALARQHDLQIRLHNASSTITAMTQREELHIRQLDVLTERVMQVEAAAAQERNLLLESQANCTDLAQQLQLTQQEVDEWRNRCSEFVERHREMEQELSVVKKKLKNTSIKAEDLAAMIERHRLEEDRGTYRRKVKKKKTGFFAWLFGYHDRDDDEDLSEMRDTAHTTLLEALQVERNSVDELETAVASLQQNNSAIAEQVQSRDLIISELNDRVAVFEEDKVVLKAALRQLQKEMSEEAPKTQKLVRDLEDAQKEIDRLHSEIESLIVTHQEEVKSLQDSISKKQAGIQEVESNLTVIGTYVDKLEERLTDFALARREIEKRERKCREIEDVAAESEEQRERLAAQVSELEKEHAELKSLFEELIQARTKLQNDFNRLSSEKKALLAEKAKLEQDLKGLSGQLAELQQDRDHWHSQSIDIDKQLNATMSTNVVLQEEARRHESEKAELTHRLNETASTQRELEDLIQGMEASRIELKQKISELEQTTVLEGSNSTEALETKDRELEELRKSISDIKEEHQRSLDAIKEDARRTRAALREEQRRAGALEETVREVAAREVEIKRTSDMKAKEAAARELQMLEAAENKVNEALAREAEARKVVEQKVREAPPIIDAVLPRPAEKQSNFAAPAQSSKSNATARAPPAIGRSVSGVNATREETGVLAPPTLPRESAQGKTATEIPSDRVAVSNKPPSSAGAGKRDDDQLPRPGLPPIFNVKGNQLPEPSPTISSTLSDKMKKQDNTDMMGERLASSLVKNGVNATSRTDGRKAHRVGTEPMFPSSSSPTVQVSNATRLSEEQRRSVPLNATKSKRKVPFRGVRKLFAKVTGVHGLFTEPSHPRQRKPKRQTQPQSVIAPKKGQQQWRPTVTSEKGRLPPRPASKFDKGQQPPPRRTNSELRPPPGTIKPSSKGQIPGIQPNAKNTTLPARQAPQRRPPFRRLRKFFSKTTGMHGVFTKPSTPYPRRVTKRAVGKSSPKNGRPPAKSPPTAGRPDMVKHTMGGIRFPQQKPESK